MNTSETPRGLSDRGIGWQAAGFTLVALVSISILEIFSGSDFWLYKAFRIAVVSNILGIRSATGRAIRLGEKNVRDGKGNPRSQIEADS